MIYALLFTWMFWIVVGSVLFVRKNPWKWLAVASPIAFTGLLYGVAQVDAGFSAVLVIGLHLVMAPRLIWEEVLRSRDDD